MNKKCLIISFDFTKSDYPPISYSIASILAQFKNTNIVDIEPYSYDLNEFLSTPKEKTEKRVQKIFQEKYLEKINDYSFIAFAAYAWSENLVNELIKIIRPKFNGKIILGGYETTALNKEKLLQVYPDVDFYIKGYAEKALEKIFRNEINDKIINEEINSENINSPYLLGVLPLNTKKIHWESKRGCPYHCDYCEYGTATNKSGIIRISNGRLEKEIALFKTNNVKEINVLDSTFLIKNEDNDILEKLLSIDSCKNICLQMHFSTIRNEKGKRFLEICQRHKDRISLEFGLQTIHDEEMKILNRKNDIPHVETVMKQLNDAGIKYSISIIFGIPYQTVESFHQTIEFIEKNGCNKFCAYPLQLPKNSKIRNRINELKIKEFQGEHFSLRFVSECNSFNQSEWEKMYIVTAFYEDKPPFCGDPIDAIKPIPNKILSDYLRGGIHCKLESKQRNCGKSIFWG
jgi:DNA repair photolyase